jgi:hypothetical protein
MDREGKEGKKGRKELETIGKKWKGKKRKENYRRPVRLNIIS